jgi:hypothetical protein
MRYRSDGLPESRLLRAGGFLGGTVLATPFAFLLFVAAGRLVEQYLPIDGAGFALLVLLPPSVAAAAVASGLSLYGVEWLRVGTPLRRVTIAAVLTGSLAVAAVVAAALFVDALLFGIDDGNPVPVAVGVGGLIAIAWASVRGGVAVRDGYRSVDRADNRKTSIGNDCFFGSPLPLADARSLCASALSLSLVRLQCLHRLRPRAVGPFQSHPAAASSVARVRRTDESGVAAAAHRGRSSRTSNPSKPSRPLLSPGSPAPSASPRARLRGARRTPRDRRRAPGAPFDPVPRACRPPARRRRR